MALIVAKKSENEVGKVVGGRMMGEWVAGAGGEILPNPPFAKCSSSQEACEP